jgi:hypothetical protein
MLQGRRAGASRVRLGAVRRLGATVCRSFAAPRSVTGLHAVRPAALAGLAGLLLAGCVADGGPRGGPVASVPPGGSGSVSAGPDALLGAPAERVLAALGQPEVQRRERPAEIWQYRGRGCVLDVFLYAIAESGGPGPKQVAHLEARDGNARAVPVDACLNGVKRNLAATRWAS